MSIQFIFGPAGSGKSKMVQEMLIEKSKNSPKENFLLIVPDQFTMQTQMDIVKRHPNLGILNIDVLSFGRLSYRVFSVTGKSDTKILDDTGKNLVLRRVASKVSEQMPFIGKNLNKQGFISEVKSSISEFMQYNMSVTDVKKLSENVDNSLLKAKLSDLYLIYNAFMEFNKDKFITGEESLDLLCKKLSMAEFIKGSTIVFDGFTGFTPIQEKVVCKLCELAKMVYITFDISSPEVPSMIGGEEKLFYLSRKGANRLKTKVKDLSVTVEEDIVITDTSKGRFCNNPELSHLEKNLFRFPYKRYEDTPKALRIINCKDLESEVSKVCLEISRLIKQEGYAYRDIAIITGDLSSYGMLFENRMRELSMPVFIDKTNALVLNPFTEYLKSILLILSKDFSYDSIFHYLRSGFTDYKDSEVDRFERYVKSLNIRGRKTYERPFTKRERGLYDKALLDAELPMHDAIRSRIFEDMSVFSKDCKTAGDYVKALYVLLTKNRSFEKLLVFENEFEKEGNLSKAREYGQIYKAVMELFDVIVSLIGDEEMSIEEFYKILEAGISEIEIGTIPGTIDRIVVGDIVRTRINEVKALFIVGVNDGNIPKNSDKGGILSMVERESLSKKGYDLAPTTREEMYTQKLYLYMNLLKPREKLFISFAGTDTEGKGLRPSYLIDTLKSIFPKLMVESFSNVPSLDKLVTLQDSSRYFATLMREYVSGLLNEEEKKLTKALLETYKEENFLLFKDIEDAAFLEYVASPLSKEIATMIYGSTIKASVSRMELYAKCAYSHFLKYGMKLKKNAEYNFEASDLGSIYHGVLDIFSSELERRGLTWTTFSEKEGREMVKKAVENYCEFYEQGLLSDDEESAYTIKKITDILYRTIETLAYQAKRGRFYESQHEFSFEREIDLKEGKKMLINGKIDRIDLYENEGKIYVKILDYKSGKRDIDITNVYHGIEQQLGLYMAEAVYHEKEKNPGKEIIPSSLLYYAIQNPMVTVESKVTKEEVEAKLIKELRLKGILESSDENIASLDENAMGDGDVLPVSFKKDGTPSKNSLSRLLSREEMGNLLDYVERMVKNIGIRINEGDISVNPSNYNAEDACEYCDYKAVCRFDCKIHGYEKRDGKDISEETAREKVLGGDPDGLYLFD